MKSYSVFQVSTMVPSWNWDVSGILVATFATKEEADRHAGELWGSHLASLPDGFSPAFNFFVA